MSLNQEYIESLKSAVQQSIMRSEMHSSDFDYLYGEIQHRIGETIGISTLKRLWGYIDGYNSIRTSTLDVLCRFVGFPDWHTFVADHCNADDEQTSHRIVTATLLCDDIEVGDKVTIEWNPNRILEIVHRGNGWFDVIQSRNSKIKVGDRFHCERFMMSQPLYIDNLVHENNEPILFVVGKKGGLTKIMTDK